MEKHRRSSIAVIALTLALIFVFSACTFPQDSTDKNDKTENDGDKNALTNGALAEGLPEVYITEKDGKQVTSKTEYSDINIRFSLSDHYRDYTNSYTDHDGGKAQIRCRGNSSYSAGSYNNKYSYKLKLDSKADLLGMGESRHWYLIANWFDATHMRNKLAFDLSGTLGMTYTQNTWVVLYYNGVYKGIYSLVESIRIDEGRVETFDWEKFAEDTAMKYAFENDLSKEAADALENKMKNDLMWISTAHTLLEYTKTETDKNGKTKAVKVSETIDLSDYFDQKKVDITSGYLIEYDNRLHGENTKWSTEHGIPVVMDSPAALSTNPIMYNYVKTLIQDFENALYSPTFHNDKGKHYSEYLDVDSLVDFWTVWNLFNNIEFGVLSLYYYIDDGKIVFGPNWDFDNASGNLVTLNEKWMRWDYWVNDRGGGGNGWFKAIMNDPYFVSLCQERWFSIREAVDDMMQSLDIYYGYIGKEAILCYETNGPRENWYLKNVNKGYGYDFETDFIKLKEWLTNRINWIDTNFAVLAPQIDGSAFTRSGKISSYILTTRDMPGADKITSYGVKADYLLQSDTKGNIAVRLFTTHTSARSVAVYLNGSKFLGEKKFTNSEPATYNISVSDLNMENGDVNVLYVIAYTGSGDIRSMTSINIRVSDYQNPAQNQTVVTFDDDTVFVKTGEPVTVPEIKETHEGFKALGWTTGDDKVYLPGEEFVPKKNTYLYVRWERLDFDSHFILN